MDKTITISDFKMHDDLSVLFSLPQARLELWIVESYEKGANQPHLMLAYGLIAPLDNKQEFNKWKKSCPTSIYNRPEKQNGSKIPKILAANIIISGASAFDTVSHMLNSKTLGEACYSTGIDTPHQSIAGLSLFSETRKREFVVRPPFIARPAAVNEGLPEYWQGSNSILKHASSIVGTIFRLNKDILWKDVEPSSIRGFLQNLLEHLSAKTGLDFLHADSRRLGNIDFVQPLACDEKFYPNVRVTWIREVNEEKRRITNYRVEIKIDELTTNDSEFLVNCRLLNVDDICIDRCQTCSGKQLPPFIFRAQEPISSGSVKIWRRAFNSNEWTLWFEETFGTPRGFSLSTSFSSEHFVKADWFSKLVDDSNSNEELIEKNFSLGDYEQYSDYKYDPWNPCTKEMRNLAEKLHSPHSKSYFYDALGSNQDDRIEKLATWFEDRLRENWNSRVCILVDPYFKEIGLEVLKRMDIKEFQFFVMTNTQAREKGDDGSCDDISSETWEPKRAADIKNLILADIEKFKNKQIIIQDLRSASQSKKQLFHDRYAFFLNKHYEIEHGYHFSNSLQGAMKDYPLLITEIPQDILKSLQQYFRQFLDRKLEIGSQRIVTIFSYLDDKKKRPFMNPTGINAMINPKTIFSVLLNNSTVKTQLDSTIEEFLTESGILSSSLDKFLISTDHVENFLLFCSKLLADEFDDIWFDFSEILARTHEHIFMQHEGVDNAFLQRLVEYLTSEHPPIIKQGNIYRPLNISLLDLGKETDLKKLLSKAAKLERYIYRPSSPGTWAILMASKALATRAPKLLVDAFEQVIKKEKSPETEYVLHQILSDILMQVRFGESDDFTSRLRASIPLLVAIDATDMPPVGATMKNSPDLKHRLSHLATQDAVWVLSYWIHQHLSARNSQSNIEDKNALQSTIIALFDELVDRFQPAGCQYLHDVIDNISGHRKGRFSVDIYNHFIGPLIQREHCSYDDVIEYWFPLLMSIAEELMNGKGYFNADVDSSVIAVVGGLLGACFKQTKHRQTELNQTVDNVTGFLGRPRIKDIDQDGWHKNIQTAIFLHAVFEMVFLASSSPAEKALEYASSQITELEPYTINGSWRDSLFKDQFITWFDDIRDKRVALFAGR